MNVPTYCQHDGRWAGQRLGTVNGATISAYGCGITCLAMANKGFDPGSSLLPNNVDDIFTNQGGYANNNGNGTVSPAPNCDLIIWGRIQPLLPAVIHTDTGYYPNNPADLNRIKSWIDQGGLVMLEVRWHGRPNLMHFVLGVGHNGSSDILVNDPETGRQQWFSSKLFGTGNAAIDILTAHFLASGKPAPAPTPAPQPTAPNPEDQVTQAAHDAAINDLKNHYDAVIATLQDQLNEAHGVLTTQAQTITSLNSQLNALVPEYQRSEVVSPKPAEYLTTGRVLAVDHSDRKPPVILDRNVTFVEYSRFSVNGQEYIRTATSHDNGDWYGIPADHDNIRPYTEPTSVLDARAAALSLSTSQQLHAIAAGSSGTLGRLFGIFKFGGKK